MSLRKKLLLTLAVTAIASVAAVAWVISFLVRRTFEKASEQNSAAVVEQFRRDFARQGEVVEHKVEAIAAGDVATQMALASDHEATDFGEFLGAAKTIAANQQLDFLEFVDGQGVILSSAQWPAKFGYKEPLLSGEIPKGAFLKREDLPDGGSLGIFAVRKVSVADKPIFVAGGRSLNQAFLAGLDTPPGTRAMIYSSGAQFSAQLLVDRAGVVQSAEPVVALIQQGLQEQGEIAGVVHWSANSADDETINAIPLTGVKHETLGVLLVGNSRRQYVEVRRQIRAAALIGGGLGVVLAILLSGWATARVTRPVERMAEAARQVEAGDWKTQVAVDSKDELGQLAESFNRMTSELLQQKAQLIQSERVAAWRELARRLAHELKNPLFPLQLTVENLVRARQQSPEQFEEIFRESSTTLLTEIANLKAIVSRFSEFSQMPQPQFQRVNLNEVVENVASLFRGQLRAQEQAAIACNLELDPELRPVAADPELLHRAVSNLVLNAMDAMPQGGTLTLKTRREGDGGILEVADTGSGLTSEERDRLFTPYYTTKVHGTGLGLAIAQSVVSDHGGRIRVKSGTGQGTTFVIELPGNLEKLRAGHSAAS